MKDTKNQIAKKNAFFDNVRQFRKLPKFVEKYEFSSEKCRRRAVATFLFDKFRYFVRQISTHFDNFRNCRTLPKTVFFRIFMFRLSGGFDWGQVLYNASNPAGRGVSEIEPVP